MENICKEEVAKFQKQAKQWWNPKGPCKILHAINPCRLNYIKEHVHPESNILDVGCGAGILTESLAKISSFVTGIDASPELIQIATEHSIKSNLNITYKNITAVELATENTKTFDIITCMELLEHVPDPLELVADCTALLKPNGKIFFSTLNRTLACYLSAVIGAEYITKSLEPGTHDYAKFIKPSELHKYCRDCNVTLQDIKGIFYNPIANTAHLIGNTSINYISYGILN